MKDASVQALSMEVSKISMESEQKDFHRGVVFSFLRYGVSLVGGFGYTFLFAHMLGSDILGTVTLLTSLLGIFKPISNLGEQFALVPALNRYAEREPQATGLFWVTLLLAFTSSLLMAVPYGLLTGGILLNFYHRPDLLGPLWGFLGVSYLLGNTLYLLAAPYQAYRQMKHLAVFEVVVGLGKILILVGIVAWAGPTLMAAIWAQGVGFLLNLILLLVFLPRVLGKPVGPVSLLGMRRDLAEIYRFSFKALPGNASISVLQHADRLVLGYCASPAVLGVYAITYSLFEKVLMMGANYEVMVFASTAKLHARGERVMLLRLFGSALRTSFGMLMPIVVLMIGFSETVLGVFGQEFSAGAMALSILMVGILLDNFSRITMAMMAGMGCPGKKAMVMMSGGGVNLLMSFLLIPGMGLVGAAWANTLGYLVTVVFCLVWLYRLPSSSGPSWIQALGIPSLAGVFLINGLLLLATEQIKPLLPFGTWGVIGFSGLVLLAYFGVGKRWFSRRSLR